MNTKEAAKKWKCSEKTVREYCKNGMIPLAEKTGRKWDIPDERENFLLYHLEVSLPPVMFRRKRAACRGRILDYRQAPDSLFYLSDMRFIIGYESYLSLDYLKKSVVTHYV
jgi:hypothetical protein